VVYRAALHFTVTACDGTPCLSRKLKCPWAATGLEADSSHSVRLHAQLFFVYVGAKNLSNGIS